MSSKPRALAFRIPDSLVPAAFCVASIAGYGEAARSLFACCFAVHTLSLFSSHGARIAFASQPSIRQVRGSVKCAILLQTACFALLSGLIALFPRIGLSIPSSMVVAGFFLNVEHLLYEYLFALGDGYSASMCQLLTSIFTVAGLILSGHDLSSLWTPASAGLSTLVAMTISIVMGDGCKGRLNARVIGCSPRAALQGMPYPIAAALLLPSASPVAFFAGLTLYELCRTPYRRSPTEAAFLIHALLTVDSAITLFAILHFLVFPGRIPNAFRGTFSAVILASICAFSIFGRLPSASRRRI